MSATDELRAELTKRGAEWKAPSSYDGSNRYDTVAGGYWFHEFDGKITIHGLTPAQAIAATIGSDKVEAVLRKLIARLGVAADFHFAPKYVDCIVEEYATKLATLGAGTCEADETDLMPFVRADSGDCDVDYIHVMECSSCGGTYEHVNGGYEFCPRCGRKVVDE